MTRYIFTLLFLLPPILLSAQTDAERALLQRATTLSDASALTNIGIALEDSGRYTEAEPFHIKALEISESRHGKKHPDTVPALTNLAINYKERGRYADAEPLYLQALAIVADSFQTALLKNNLAFLYQEQYRYDEAKKLYDDALDIHTKRTQGNDDEYMASPLQNRARLYYFQSREAEPNEKRRLLQNAQADAKRALNIDEEIDKDHPDTGASLNMLAVVYSDQGRYAEAESLLKRALQIYERAGRKNHPWTAECMHDLATLYERQQRYQEAEPLRNHTIDVYQQSGAEAHLGQDWYKSRAALYKKTNRPKEAVADLKEAMNLSFKVREHASGDYEQKAQTFAQYYNLFEHMVDWQYELGNMNEAYEAMEQSRARGLLNMLLAHHIDLLAGVSEEIAQPLRAAEDAARAEIAIAEKTDQTEALNAAKRKLAVAMEAIYSVSPAYRQMTVVALDSVRSELIAEKSLALEYFIGGEKSYLLLYGFDTEPRLLPLVLDDKQAELFGVEPGPLTTQKLATLLQAKEDGVPQLYGSPTVTGIPDTKTLEKLHVLWTVLIPHEPIRAKMIDGETFERLLILPDRALARFPFESLIVDLDPVNPRYLLDVKLATMYAPSASMYHFLKKLKTESGKPHVLTVGGPYDNIPRNNEQPKRPSTQRQNNHRGAYNELKETKKETEWIETSCKENGIAVTRFNADQSTEAKVRQNIAGKSIVHFACHGVAEGENHTPFSALLLTIGNPHNLKDDGFLELTEMFELSLKACELAVLSACVTNLGLNQPGEGTWSLGRGMMASGAKRVVTTNWQVDDEASARLVYFFIKKINETISESSDPDHAAALRQARQEIRKDQGNPTWQHPYYWAPFVLIGPN